MTFLFCFSKATIGSNIGLGIHDFALVIQTKLQAEMLENCGTERVVCVDATHGTNMYSFQLITILVIDEFGEGFPAGWCLSNKEDHILLTNFFRHIRTNSGNITPNWFMSDDADQYYTAWTAVFGNQPQKLLCTWHVDRAWRKALTKIKDKQVQVTVYHTLRVLLEEREQSTFQQLLQNTILQWAQDPLMLDFSNYFTTYYSPRSEQWAVCYRKGSCINTNMYAEAFHRVLKHIYLGGIVNKRIDNCVNMLMRFARDKIFDRLQKIEKGKSTTRLQLIAGRHKSSLDLPLQLVCAEADGKCWNVKSSSTSDVYTVRQKYEKCPYTCLLICRQCSVCVHQYSCTCLDSITRSTICKHVHLVMRFLSGGKINFPSYQSIRMGDTISQALFKQVKTKETIEGFTLLKEKLTTKHFQIKTIINRLSNKEELLALHGELDRLIHVYSTGGLRNKEPCNKHIQPQRRGMYSTKRKRQKGIRIAKPSSEEKSVLTAILLAGNIRQTITEDQLSKLKVIVSTMHSQ